jgi:ketosteroid isomerase-like protein
LRWELEAFTIDFWHEVDFKDARGAAAYYLDDAVFATSVREYRGRAQLEAFYARRRDQAPRVSVHTLSNFRAEPMSDSRVRCSYTLALFAADGEPVLASRPAVMVATVEEVLVRVGDS